MSTVEDTDSIAVTAGASQGAQEAKVSLWQRPWLFRYGSLVFILVLWEVTGPMVNPIFFTYPSAIAVAAWQLTASGELPRYFAQSLQILIYGLGLAILVGIPLGILMARVRQVDWTLEIYINALYATPMVALVPILVLWLGIYMTAKVTVVFLFALFPILINTYQGVRGVDRSILEVARSFRTSELRVWLDVLLPWSVPYIAAGIRLAIGRGLVGMVIAEFYTSISGLGYMIVKYAHIFQMDKTFVPVILLMVMGVGMTAGLQYIENRIAPWSRKEK